MVETLAIPDLSDANVIGFTGGVRPCRRGGLRIEAETLGSEVGNKVVVHNYGHGGCGVTIGLGTADEVVKIVREHSAPDESVAVLGAGVVGLTTAVRLIDAGYRVRIISEALGTETVSAVAGALWLPTGIDEFGGDQKRLSWFHGVLRRSFDAMRSLDDRYGIESLPVYEPVDAPENNEFFVSGTISNPVALNRLPIGVYDGPGRVFETLFIHTPKYLRRLIEDICERGGVFETGRIERLQDLGRLSEPLVVNCLAMGSRSLFDDRSMYPARGMLVKLKPQKLGYVKHDGYRYMFPREDALILGGCFLEDDWRSEPDEGICREILREHRTFWGQA